MAHQQKMVQNKEVQCGSFVWKVANFQKYGYGKSCEFKFGSYNCCLCIPKCLNGFSIDGMKEVDLITENCPVDAPMFSEKTVYTLSLIDVCGQEFQTSCGTVRGENKIIMMVLFMEYLKKYEYELLKKGTLVFRLTWKSGNETSQHDEHAQLLPDLKSEQTPPNKLLETLSNDFSCFYESQVDTDCVLRVGETQFPVHRTILSARSTVFSAMFHHDTSESRTGEVVIRDVEATSMGNALHYIYSGKVRGLSEDTAAPMYILADKYALIELRNACLQFLIHNLTTDNVCDAALVAHTHAEAELEDKVVDFIEKRLDDIEESDNWMQFLKSNPSLAIKLLRSALRASKKDKIKRSSK